LIEMEFPAYRNDELSEILKDRASYLFRPGTLPVNLIRITSIAAKGDARIGLEILRRTGRKAEERGLRKVTVNEVREALREAMKLRKSYLLSKLNEHQRIIYSILEEKGKIGSGELYRKYCKEVEESIGDRTYRNYMKKRLDLGWLARKVMEGGELMRF